MLPTWDRPEYPHVHPGRYSAVASRVQGPEWVRRFRRWSLMVEFALLGEDARVCAFFNMGSDPQKPHAGPHSRYFQAWTLANGERPHRKQRLDPAVFLDGQVYEIEVSDSDTDADGKQKHDSLVYSRVTAVISAESSIRHNHPITQSTDSSNHESGIMQSRNQESTNQGGQGSGDTESVAHRPRAGKAHAQQTRRAGASAPAQARRPGAHA